MATEDFTTYTETDAGSSLTVTADDITSVDTEKGHDTYVYDDKGASHFDGDWEHLFEAWHDSLSNSNAEGHTWAVANSVGASHTIDLASGDCLFVQSYDLGGGSGGVTLTIVEIDGGTFNNATGFAIDDETAYWYAVERDESIGTYGELEVRCYSNSGRTTLVDSETIALATAKKDYRYFYGFQSKGESTGAQDWDGIVSDMDLQESSSQTLTQGSLFDTEEVFYTGAIGAGLEQGTSLGTEEVFYAASIGGGLSQGSLFDTEEAFYSAAIGAGLTQSALLDTEEQFYVASIRTQLSQSALFDTEEVFYAHTISREGDVTSRPWIHQNTFY